MITLKAQVFQLVMGLFLGCYLSIIYHYFNQFFSSKKNLIKKNIYDFLFIIFNLFLLISFLENNTHGVIRFYPLALFALSFLIVQFYIKDKLNKNFIKVYVLSQSIVKYLKFLITKLFISKTLIMALNQVLKLILFIKKTFSKFKSKNKKENSV